MSIPAFRSDGWLPEGHFESSWDQVSQSFAGEPNSHRRRVFDLLVEWCNQLRKKGISGMLVLDGSFISSVENPSDFDVILVYDDESALILNSDPDAKSLIDYQLCKDRGFDVFVLSASSVRDYPQWARLDAFDQDKNGVPKGVVEIEI